MFTLFGYLPTDTPALETLAVLNGGDYGEEARRLIFEVTSTGGGRPLGLRYDQTVALSRLIDAANPTMPFRRYQTGLVWRADRPARGRLREFWQADVDLVGVRSDTADAEVISVVAAATQAVAGEPVSMRVGSRPLVNALLDTYGTPAERAREALVVFDKYDKIGAAGIVDELERRGFPAVMIAAAAIDLTQPDPAAEALGRLRGSDLVADLDRTIALIDPTVTVTVDPFLARGLDYYTGLVFEATVPAAGGLTVAAGGRYDNMLPRGYPAVGGSVGIDRILSFLADPPPGAWTDVWVTVWDPPTRAAANRLAAELRAAGLRTVVSLSDGRLSRQMRDAAQANARYVIIAGPDEQASATVVIKNLSTGEQSSVADDQVVGWFNFLPS